MWILVIVLILLLTSNQPGVTANPISGLMSTITNLVSGLFPGVDTATLGLFVALSALFLVFYHHHAERHVRLGA